MMKSASLPPSLLWSPSSHGVLMTWLRLSQRLDAALRRAGSTYASFQRSVKDFALSHLRATMSGWNPEPD